MADETTRNKGGRPPKRPTQRRTARIMVRMDKREHDALRAWSDASGVKQAVLARQMIVRGLREAGRLGGAE